VQETLSSTFCGPRAGLGRSAEREIDAALVRARWRRHCGGMARFRKALKGPDSL
jgi:hypothetical protein